MKVTRFTTTTEPYPIAFSDLNEDRMSLYCKFVFGESIKIKVENGHTYEFTVKEIIKENDSNWKFIYRAIMIRATSDKGFTKDLSCLYTIYFDGQRRSGHVLVGWKD